MNIAVIAITRHGIARAGQLLAVLPEARLSAPEKFRAEAEAAAPGRFDCYTGKTGERMATLFAEAEGIVALFSLGVVVRLIAPLLGDKTRDPAIVVVDESGRFAIPVLSGHLGGANALAARIASRTAATLVLTTASDVRQTLAVDLLGRELGWRIEASHEALVHASAAVVNEDAVALVQECGSDNWWTGHATGREGPLPANLQRFSRLEDVDVSRFAAVLWISDRPLPEACAAALDGRCVTYRPAPHHPRESGDPVSQTTGKKLTLGLGCDRDTPLATIEQVVAEALALAGATRADVVAAASIDIKSDEAGLLAFARGLGLTLAFHPAAALARIPVPNPSETVRKHTGTPSVSEAAALIAAGDGGCLVIEKHRLRGPDGRNATVSIARMSP